MRQQMMGAAVVLAILTTSGAAPGAAASPQEPQEPSEQASPQPAEPDEALVEQAKPLYMLVDAAMEGASAGTSAWNVDPSGEKPPASATAAGEATLTTDFSRVVNDQVYMPLQITLDPKAVASPSVVVYVRALERGAGGGSDGGAAEDSDQEDADQEDADQEGAQEEQDVPTYAFEDFYVQTLKSAGPGEPIALNGYVLLSPGSYDLYVALRERADDTSDPFQATVLKESLDVPNYFGDDLMASPTLLAKGIAELPADPSPEEMHENPYTFGRAQLDIATDGAFETKDEFNLLLFVYNFGEKPDVTVEYQLFTTDDEGEGEEEVAKIEPQTYNESTVDAVTQELPVSLSFSVAELGAGNFRLAVTVTDNASGKSLTRDARFTVASS